MVPSTHQNSLTTKIFRSGVFTDDCFIRAELESTPPFPLAVVREACSVGEQASVKEQSSQAEYTSGYYTSSRSDCSSNGFAISGGPSELTECVDEAGQVGALTTVIRDGLPQVGRVCSSPDEHVLGGGTSGVDEEIQCAVPGEREEVTIWDDMPQLEGGDEEVWKEENEEEEARGKEDKEEAEDKIHTGSNLARKEVEHSLTTPVAKQRSRQKCKIAAVFSGTPSKESTPISTPIQTPVPPVHSARVLQTQAKQEGTCVRVLEEQIRSAQVGVCTAYTLL